MKNPPSKEEHGFGKFFGLAPSPERHHGRDEVRILGGIFRRHGGAGPALPNVSLRRAGYETFTRMLRGARCAAMARAIETRPPFVAAYAVSALA
jgi:hypothetical protein